MKIVVKLFGPEADVAGRPEVAMEFDGAPNCAQLRERLAELEPGLVPRLGSCRFALNHEFVSDACVLQEQDEVALIGLVSGG